MKPKATLHFIYCLVAKRWGKAIKIKRDPLHHMYSVNQYGVSLTGVPPSNVYAHLRDTLRSEGYQSDKIGEFKLIDRGVTTYLFLRLTGNSVDVSIYAYKFSKE